MRKGLLIIFLIVSVFPMCALEAQSDRVLTIAGITGAAPLQFSAKKTGRPAGIYVELWQQWSNKTGIPVNYIITTAEAAEHALESGSIDIIMGFNVMQPVNHNFKTSKPVYTYSTYIYSNRNINKVSSLMDLIPYKVGILKEEGEFNYLQKLYPDVLFVEMESTEEIIREAEENRISVFISGETSANFELSRKNLWRKFSQSDDAVFTHIITAVVKSGNIELLEKINRGFEQISEAEKNSIESSWTGGNFGRKIPWIYISIIIVIISIIAGVSLIWYWNYQLRKRVTIATLELSESREFLQTILNSMHSMICTINAEGEIININSVIKSFTGRSDILPHEKLWDIIPQIQADKEEIIRAITEGRHLELKGVRSLSNSYSEIYYDISLYPAATHGGKCGVLRIDDVTEDIAKDNQLMQAQRMEMIGIMAGGLAHDFNNILGAIYGTVSMLNNQIKDKSIDIDTLKDYAEVIEQASERAAGVVKRFMLISRKSEPLLNPFDLNEAVIQVVNICRNSIDRSVDLKISLTDEKTVVMADIHQIEQALLNLCINASHAMTIMRDAGEVMGGDLKIKTERIFMSEDVSIGNIMLHRGIYIVIGVSDTGVGIEPEMIEKLFDPFFTTKEEKHGTGLGLLMIYNIVKEHGGAVKVDSEHGKGSEFSIYLPACEEDIVHINKNMKYRIKGEGNILLIDDELLVRKTVSRMLSNLGYNVISVESGLEGIAILRERSGIINAVITDLSMPLMSGKEIYIRIRDFDSCIPVGLISGNSLDRRVTELHELGLHNVLNKPFNMEDLSQFMLSLTASPEFS